MPSLIRYRLGNGGSGSDRTPPHPYKISVAIATLEQCPSTVSVILRIGQTLPNELKQLLPYIALGVSTIRARIRRSFSTPSASAVRIVWTLTVS